MNESRKTIKCLVWDLDQTLWSGILLEGDEVVLRSGVRETIVELDRRGVLHSIASQNAPQPALRQLAAWSLADYFVHPQFSLPADKPSQIAEIARRLDLQLEHIAFVDDDPSQRAYVAGALPAVTVLAADQAPALPRMPLFAVEHLTEEARRRREFYLAESQRREVERGWSGRRLDFLRHCQMALALRPAVPQDVPRIVELVARTNQLNTAAHRFGAQEIAGRQRSPDHRLTVAHLSDRFGDYGTVGALIVQQAQQACLIELLLVSCRVLGRGVGEALLCYGLRQAQAQGRRSVRALYRKTDYNRGMRMLFVTHGFKRDGERDGVLIYRHDLGIIPDDPAWLEIQVT